MLPRRAAAPPLTFTGRTPRRRNRAPGRRGPKALEPPVGGPSALSLWRRGACPTGAPVLPDRAPAGGVSGPPRRAMGWYRRDADLGPRRDRSRPAPSGMTTEWPAVRVHARGGGGLRAGFPLRSLCLAQRRERRGRVHGLTHQLAERALLRAACGRRGEHVFGRLRRGSDGTRTLRTSVCGMPRIRLYTAKWRADFLQSKLQGRPATRAASGRPTRTRRRPWCGPCRRRHR
jgi:hypothetical protein